MDRGRPGGRLASRSERRAGDRWAALLSAIGYLALGAYCRRRPSRWEGRLFRAANDDTDDVAALRVPQQLGTPWVLPLLAAVGLATHRPHLALYGACALPLEKGLEVGVKRLFERERPAAVDPRTELRDDAPTTGPSYPSGHAAIAFTAVGIVSPYLPGRVRVLPAAGAAASGWVRVRQGAHFPLDVVGGALLAATVVFTVRAAFGRPGSL